MFSEIDRFIKFPRRCNPEARTWRDYGYDLKQFFIVTGHQRLNSITYRDVDHFISNQLFCGFKPTTINRRLTAIASLYKFLMNDDPTIICPVLARRHYLREPQSLSRPVSEEDLDKLFSVVIDSRDRAMFLIMLRCGLRIAEVARLTIPDVYLEEKYPRLSVYGKGSRERTVYLSSQAKNALKVYLEERPKVTSDYLFLGYQNDSMSTTAIHKRLVRYRSQAAIHITAHRLRHNFANDLVRADVPVTTIQKLIGHRWLETTQIYILANDHQVKADFYNAVRKLDSWQLHLEMMRPQEIVKHREIFNQKGGARTFTKTSPRLSDMTDHVSMPATISCHLITQRHNHRPSGQSRI